MSLHTVLEQVSAASTKTEKVEILKRYNCLGLRDILKGAFDDTIEWELPKGVPPFTTNTSNEGHTPTTLDRATPKLAYFVKGHPSCTQLKPMVRERMFLEILEGVPKEEAELLIAVKEKKLEKKYRGLTKDLVLEAFPKLIDPSKQVAKKPTVAKKTEAPAENPAAATPAPEAN